jgi:hypothetical protein
MLKTIAELGHILSLQKRLNARDRKHRHLFVNCSSPEAPPVGLAPLWPNNFRAAVEVVCCLQNVTFGTTRQAEIQNAFLG